MFIMRYFVGVCGFFGYFDRLFIKSLHILYKCCPLHLNCGRSLFKNKQNNYHNCGLKPGSRGEGARISQLILVGFILIFI